MIAVLVKEHNDVMAKHLKLSPLAHVKHIRAKVMEYCDTEHLDYTEIARKDLPETVAVHLMTWSGIKESKFAIRLKLALIPEDVYEHLLEVNELFLAYELLGMVKPKTEKRDEQGNLVSRPLFPIPALEDMVHKASVDALQSFLVLVLDEVRPLSDAKKFTETWCRKQGSSYPFLYNSFLYIFWLDCTCSSLLSPPAHSFCLISTCGNLPSHSKFAPGVIACVVCLSHLHVWNFVIVSASSCSWWCRFCPLLIFCVTCPHVEM